MALDGEVDDTPLAPAPGQVLQIMRIVQEALANALRHARASELRVHATKQGTRVELRVPGHAGAAAPH
jgi:signal transduction histidine kinase